jgi:hypothetical protein
MKVFCCYTEAHEVLLRKYFSPSIPNDMELLPTHIDLSGPGDFLSKEFIQCIHEKVGRIAQSLRENPGEIIVWSDVDIVFCRPASEELRKLMDQGPGGKIFDILLQTEGNLTNDVNTGFMVCRAGEKIALFFDQVLESLRQQPDKNEQYVINQLLPTSNLSWGYLPETYYARSQGWPPAADIALYHANLTQGRDGVGQKIDQFRDLALLRRHRILGGFWIRCKRLPQKLMRLIGKRP